MADLYVNGAFVGQRITGQQRYAGQVAERLVDTGARWLAPPRAIAGRPALSHAWAHTVLPSLSARGGLISLTARSPIVARRHTLVVHDLFVLQHPEWYSRAYVMTHGPVLAAQLRAAAALAVVSPWVGQQVRAMFPRKPIAVAANAPSDVFYRPSADALPSDVQRLVDVPGVEGFFFAVGSRDPRKNFPRLVEAYSSLTPTLRRAYPLLIAGVESRVFASGTAEAIPGATWLGYVDDAALAGLYASATGVVVPSLAEGFGLPVVEALAAGARIAVSDIEPFRWIAGDRALYFDPLAVEDIARALQAIVDDPPPSGGEEPMSARFTWAASAGVIAELAASLR